jgi:O-antigen/teichoic acid export membrane protein
MRHDVQAGQTSAAVEPAAMIARLASPYAVGVASRLGIQVLAFAQMMVASRYFDLAEFGVYALGWAVCVIANSFLYTGFYQALLRSTRFEEDRDSAFWAIAAIGGGAAAVMAAVGLALGGPAATTGAMFLLLAPIPALRSLCAWNESQILRAGKVRIVSSYPVATEALALAVLVVGLSQGLGLLSLVAGRYAALLGDLLLTTGVVRALPGLRVSAAALGRLRGTALPLWGTSALGMFTQYGADLILGAFASPAAVGAFRGGSRISQTVSDLVLQPLTILSWSRFTGLEKAGQAHRMGQAWLENMGLGAFMLWPVLVSVALLAPEIVVVVFSDTWLPAAVVVTILCVARGLRFLSTLLEPALICADRGRQQLTIRSIGAAVLLAGLLLFGRHGVEAAGYAHVASGAVVAVLSLRAILPALRVSLKETARALAPGFAAAVVCGLAVAATQEMRQAMGPAQGLALTVALLACLWLAFLVWGFRRRLLALPQA